MGKRLLRYLSQDPISASLWTDLSPANVVVTAVVIITSHVIELVSRSGLSRIVVCYPSEQGSSRQKRCPCG